MPAEQPRCVFLTGFSGTGKSAVATLAAKALGWRVVDTDTLIEQSGGRAIAEVFRNDGEARFRQLEREAIARAASEENVVVATGGGALIAQENRRAMAEAGLVVCLEARAETIVARLRGGDVPVSERPLLAGGDPLMRVTELKARRQHLYALADVTIDTD